MHTLFADSTNHDGLVELPPSHQSNPPPKSHNTSHGKFIAVLGQIFMVLATQPDTRHAIASLANALRNEDGQNTLPSDETD
jgi:hypothetical protein